MVKALKFISLRRLKDITKHYLLRQRFELNLKSEVPEHETKLLSIPPLYTVEDQYLIIQWKMLKFQYAGRSDFTVPLSLFSMEFRQK